MNKVFFATLTIASFIYASESPSSLSPRFKISSSELKKNDSNKIDIDQMVDKAKSNKDFNPMLSRVRKQSLGSAEFAKEEWKTEKNFNRSRSESK